MSIASASLDQCIDLYQRALSIPIKSEIRAYHISNLAVAIENMFNMRIRGQMTKELHETINRRILSECGPFLGNNLDFGGSRASDVVMWIRPVLELLFQSNQISYRSSL